MSQSRESKRIAEAKRLTKRRNRKSKPIGHDGLIHMLGAGGSDYWLDSNYAIGTYEPATKRCAWWSVVDGKLVEIGETIADPRILDALTREAIDKAKEDGTYVEPAPIVIS